MTVLRQELYRDSRRALIWLALAVAVGAAVGVWKLQGNAVAAEALPSATATRGDIVVSVGGVGRIIEAKAPDQIAAGTGTGSGASAAANAPANAVFPGAAGHVRQLLVVPGQRVRAGSPLAILDDGGAAARAIIQAQNDLAIARLELQQKRKSDPAKGLPPIRAELVAGDQAVRAANARLERLFAPARRAEVSAAQLDLKRAESDLAALRGTPAARARAISVARENMKLAQHRLNLRLAPASEADVSAVDVEVRKAAADLAALRRPVLATAEALVAAEQAVTAAQRRLDRLNGPPDPAAVALATSDLRRAEADLAAYAPKATDPAAIVDSERAARQAAVDSAKAQLAKVSAPASPADVATAQHELDKAKAELAALKNPAAPSPEALASAEQAVDAAKRKRARLLAAPPAADVSAARLELKRAEAELKTLQAGPTPEALAAAAQAVEAAKARLDQLLRPPLASDASTARLEVRRAQAELAALRARGAPASQIDIALAELRVAAAAARLDAARVTKRLLTVRAPWAGTVTSVLTVRGASVDALTPVVTVADLDHLAVTIDLSEFDAAAVESGMRANVSVDALGGETFPGKVHFVAPTGSSSGSGVVTFPVRVSLAEPEGLRPGMNVSVRIITAQKKGVVQVPLEAVITDEDDNATVQVLDAAGNPAARPVVLGLANNKTVEIVKGLKVGTRVLLAESQGGGEAEE